jgi:hypothetical protein
MRVHPVNIDLALSSDAMLIFSKFLNLVRDKWPTSAGVSTFDLQNRLAGTEQRTPGQFMGLAPEPLPGCNGGW